MRYFWAEVPKGSMVPHREDLRLCFYVFTFFCPGGPPPCWTLQTPWLASQTILLALRPSGKHLKPSSWPLRPFVWPLDSHAGFLDPLVGLLTLCRASLTLILSGWPRSSSGWPLRLRSALSGSIDYWLWGTRNCWPKNVRGTVESLFALNKICIFRLFNALLLLTSVNQVMNMALSICHRM